MITYAELFQFVMMITAMIALVLQATKKKQPPSDQTSGYSVITVRANRLPTVPLHL